MPLDLGIAPIAFVLDVKPTLVPSQNNVWARVHPRDWCRSATGRAILT